MRRRLALVSLSLLQLILQGEAGVTHTRQSRAYKENRKNVSSEDMGSCSDKPTHLEVLPPRVQGCQNLGLNHEHF